MKTIEQIEAQIADLQADLAALKAQPKEWPQVGDEYWYVGDYGDIFEDLCGGAVFSKRVVSQGNAFRTQAEAEAERDARAVVAELRKQPGLKRFVLGEENWCVQINLSDAIVGSDYWANSYLGWHSIYFNSYNEAMAAINAVGADRILKAARWWACGEY